ncbi:MAG: SIMPL domain-containing protein [bacterium]|nr:SIMPL domain-containing protein [bacterium]
MEKNTSVVIAWVVTGVVVLVFGALTAVVLVFGRTGPTISPDGTSIIEGITATGDGTVKAVPDQGEVTLGVETRNADATIASQQTNSKAAAIVEAIKALGIAPADIQTVNLSVYPEYDYDISPGEQSITGYVASNTVAIKTIETSQLSAIVDAGLKAGANQLQGAYFSFTEETQKMLEEQARSKATSDARQKAEAIAAGSGVQLGKLIASTESNYGFPIPIAAYAEDVTPVETGSSEVTISITVTYEIK